MKGITLDLNIQKDLIERAVKSLELILRNQTYDRELQMQSPKSGKNFGLKQDIIMSYTSARYDYNVPFDFLCCEFWWPGRV